jgi:hypothetical protein
VIRLNWVQAPLCTGRATQDVRHCRSDARLETDLLPPSLPHTPRLAWGCGTLPSPASAASGEGPQTNAPRSVLWRPSASGAPSTACRGWGMGVTHKSGAVWLPDRVDSSLSYQPMMLQIGVYTQSKGCRSETDDAERAQKLTTETRRPRRSQGLCCNRAFESKRGQLPNQQQSAPVPSVPPWCPICPDDRVSLGTTPNRNDEWGLQLRPSNSVETLRQLRAIFPRLP